MISALITIVVVLLVCGVIWYAVTELLPLLGLPEPFVRVIRVVLIVIICIIVIYALLGLIGSVPNIRIG